MLLENFHSREESTSMLNELLEANIYPVVYAYIEGNEKFSYLPNKINRATADFIESRKNDFRNTPIETEKDLYKGKIFNIACIGEEEKLQPFFEKYKDKYHCVYQKDYYTNEQFLY